MCFERIASPGPPRCSDPSCRGGSAVCEPCSEMVERCVYCREPRRLRGGAEDLAARLYMALYYTSVIGYLLGQAEAPDSDPPVYWDPDSDPE